MDIITIIRSMYNGMQGLRRACQNPLPDDIVISFKTIYCPKFLRLQALCCGNQEGVRAFRSSK